MNKTILLMGFPLVLFSCGSKEQGHDHGSTGTEAYQEQVKTDPDAKEVTVHIYAGDDMKFNIKEINVREGQQVKVVLSHTGKMDKSTMGHNFVLLKEGVKASAFGAEAINYRDNDYLPKDTKDIIVHTRMLSGGESDSVTFAAPQKGVYEFLCSYAGHAAIMKGKLIVE